MDYKDLIKLQRRANQRLREIEKQGLTKASNAYREIEKQSFRKMLGVSADNIRFIVNKKMNERQLTIVEKKINDFLNAKTSTTKGIKNKYQKIFNKTISNKEFDRLAYVFDTGLWKELSEKFDSDTAYKTIQQIQSDDLSQQEIDDLLDLTIQTETFRDLKEKFETIDFTPF